MVLYVLGDDCLGGETRRRVFSHVEWYLPDSGNLVGYEENQKKNGSLKVVNCVSFLWRKVSKEVNASAKWHLLYDGDIKWSS
jgi:hypothetical protein